MFWKNWHYVKLSENVLSSVMEILSIQLTIVGAPTKRFLTECLLTERFLHITFPCHQTLCATRHFLLQNFPVTNVSCTTKRIYEGSSGENIFIGNVF